MLVEEGMGNRKIRKCTIPEFPIRNLKMDDPKDEFPSERILLNFGLEIQESCIFEISDFPIPGPFFDQADLIYSAL